MKIIAVFSGGLDSTVMATELLAAGHELKFVSIDYGQRHCQELLAAEDVHKHLQATYPGQVPESLHIIDMGAAARVMRGSSQTSNDVPVPQGHYADDTMRATVVPNRNMILLALATAEAIASGYDAVAYGAHSGDHAIYPDCRPAFTIAMRGAISLCNEPRIDLLTPFINIDKAEIVARGAALKAPMQLTWSCYEAAPKHCGKCGTCVERREAFTLSGVHDPTEYEAS